MCEVAKSQDGLISPNETIDPQALNKFAAYAEQNEIFVFHKAEKAGEQKHIGEDYIEKLDAPFKVFSYEIFDGALTSAHADDLNPAFGDVRILSVMVCELAPKQYDFYAFVESTLTGKVTNKVIYTPTTDDQTSWLNLTRDYIDRLSSSSHGTETHKAKVKLGTGKNKKMKTFRHIIHINPKQNKAKVLSFKTGKEINWDTSFSVRGHWRELKDSIGKDREGARVVKGFTWVNEHTKGDASAITKKVRKVGSKSAD